MGKIHHILLAIVFVMLTFSACGGDKDNQITNKDTTVQPEQPSGDVVLQSIRIESDVKNIEAFTLETNQIFRSFNAYGLYSDGHEELITDKVRLRRNRPGVYYGDDDTIHFIEQGQYDIHVTYKGLSSNHLTFEVGKDSTPLLHYVRNDSKRSYGKGRGTQLELRLLEKPSADTNVNIKLNTDSQMHFFEGTREKRITFAANDYYPRSYYIDIIDEDINATVYKDYTISFDPIESNDPSLQGFQKASLTVHKANNPKLFAPPVVELRAALPKNTIRFRVTSDERDLTYSIVNAPLGIKLAEHFTTDVDDHMRSGAMFEWTIPENTPAGFYDVTIKAVDIEGRTGEISFKIKVPKTTLIQTKVENNELIVTDTTSRLYGMKIKGHNGEDVSQMKLKAVDYLDVKRKFAPKKINDVVERNVFIIENIPTLIDIKFPAFMDTFDERNKLRISFEKSNKENNYWDQAYVDGYIYEGTNGLVLKDDGFNMFMLMIIQSQDIQ